MTRFNARTRLISAVLCAGLAVGPVLAQVSSSGSVNGINYVVIGGSDQSIDGSGGGLQIVTDGVVVNVTTDMITVDGTSYAVDRFETVEVDQSQGGLLVSVDGREVMSASPAQLLAARAEDGDLGAMNDLAILLFQGEGIAADTERAEALLRASAEGGNRVAQSNLAERLARGIGLESNEAEGFEWAIKSADQGYPSGLFTAGQMLIYGVGTAVDAPRGIAYLEQALDGGLAKAATELGFIYGTGVEVPLDSARGLSYYQTGADMGNARSAFNIAVIAYESDGDLVSIEEGLAAIDQAIELGYGEDTTALQAELQAMLSLPPARFFYAKDGEAVGPITLDELQALLSGAKITTQTLTWEGGTENWVPASDLLAQQN